MSFRVIDAAESLVLSPSFKTSGWHTCAEWLEMRRAAAEVLISRKAICSIDGVHQGGRAVRGHGLSSGAAAAAGRLWQRWPKMEGAGRRGRALQMKQSTQETVAGGKRGKVHGPDEAHQTKQQHVCSSQRASFTLSASPCATQSLTPKSFSHINTPVTGANSHSNKPPG